MAAIWNNVFTSLIVESIYIDLDRCIINPLLESLSILILTQSSWTLWVVSFFSIFETGSLWVSCTCRPLLSLRGSAVRWGAVSGCQREHELILPAEEAGNYPSRPPLLSDSPSIRPGDGALSKPCMRQLSAQDSVTNESIWGIEFVIVREA